VIDAAKCRHGAKARLLDQIFVAGSGGDAYEIADFSAIRVHEIFFVTDGRRLRLSAGMIGRSQVMQKLLERVRAAARIKGSVLVTGETGTGKELVARSIHEMSDRMDTKFVAIDCGAMPEELIESELFGHKRGAFTSALTDKPGLFEEASGGTLFLDEIGNTGRRFQAKLLRALQERQIRRIGDLTTRKVDIRVIAATNCDLTSMVRRGEFREDLFYRLNVFPIHVPPLRRRMEDLPLLVEHILHGRKTVSHDAMMKLQAYAFPGNVRELENIVESAMYVAAGSVIEQDDVVLPHTPFVPSDLGEIVVDNFWESVARPFADRLVTRAYVKEVVRRGLVETNGSYRKLITHFKMPESDYKRFMDFLRRHHCNVDYRQYRKKE
jgi:transcriptional regulator with GAF, ATPase, and Fis domain